MRFAAPFSLLFFVIGQQLSEEITLPVRPAGPIQQQEEPVDQIIDSFSEDEIYLVESDEQLLIVTFPDGIVDVLPFEQGKGLFSRFAGGNGPEFRSVQKKFGYGLTGTTTGDGQLLLIPISNPSGLIRQNITITEGRGEDLIDPIPPPLKDDVDRAFESYEQGWRDLQRQLADKLDSGEITSEAAAADWFRDGITEVRRRAFGEILELEAIEFGGDDWSAQRHADYIRGYVK
jgi:hypothetical protein